MKLNMHTQNIRLLALILGFLLVSKNPSFSQTSKEMLVLTYKKTTNNKLELSISGGTPSYKVIYKGTGYEVYKTINTSENTVTLDGLREGNNIIFVEDKNQKVGFIRIKI